jgi:hypothetical protein
MLQLRRKAAFRIYHFIKYFAGLYSQSVKHPRWDLGHKKPYL